MNNFFPKPPNQFWKSSKKLVNDNKGEKQFFKTKIDRHSTKNEKWDLELKLKFPYQNENWNCEQLRHLSMEWISRYLIKPEIWIKIYWSHKYDRDVSIKNQAESRGLEKKDIKNLQPDRNVMNQCSKNYFEIETSNQLLYHYRRRGATQKGQQNPCEFIHERN